MFYNSDRHQLHYVSKILEDPFSRPVVLVDVFALAPKSQIPFKATGQTGRGDAVCRTNKFEFH